MGSHPLNRNAPSMRSPDAATLEHLITNAMQANDWATVADLEPRLDAAAQPKDPPSLAGAALWYAEQGLHVFPLQPHRKIPHRGSRGCKDATTDRDAISNWWHGEPDSNIGIATGHLIDVIDIDGPEGVHSWAQMIETLPPILGAVSTPRWDEQKQQPRLPRGGGTHLYIAATGDGNAAKIFPGVDYRGLGGYVCAPPSVMPNDVYRWRRPLELP